MGGSKGGFLQLHWRHRVRELMGGDLTTERSLIALEALVEYG